MTSYTVADLQAIDERCREIAVSELGLDAPEVIYHLVRPEEVYFAAANGLPARYSSARWGAQFDEDYGRYRRGEARVYELIFNTRPVHAYLMEGNSLVAQTLVIAHCLGHGYVFETNGWLGVVDRDIMPRVLSAAERIADYMAAHGRERVEDFLDACHAIAIHQPQAQLVRHAAVAEPDDEERERWSWAGAVEPFEQVRSVVRTYDDEALLREFLTPKVCALSRLYAFERDELDPRRIRISSREADAVRDVLIPQVATFGIPHIEIVDADFGGRGELLLEHRHEAIGLDAEYARGTLTQIAMLWGKPCTVRTVRGRDTDEPVWFTGHPNGRSEQRAHEPG